MAPSIIENTNSNLSLEGLRAWYDAGSKVFQNSSATNPVTIDSSVVVWKDQSGNNNDLVQLIPEKQPTFKKYHRCNKSYINFNGVNSMVSSTKFQQSFKGDCSVFIVFKSKPTQEGDGLNRLLALELDDTNTNRLWIGHGISNCLCIGVGNSNLFHLNHCIANDEVNLLTVTRTGNNEGIVKAYLNKKNIFAQDWKSAAPTLLEPSFLNVGGEISEGGLQGYIGEIKIYGSCLTNAQQSSVENYLFNKWSI